jgi:DNA-binding CsgD family transcriptional regulator
MAWHGFKSGIERPLLGRSVEREAIEGLLEAVRDGLGGVLVLTGEAGIGKTRLLDHAAAVGVDLNVVRLAGVESEARLGYGALHRVLRPFLDRIDQLPGPQRDALRATFGLVDAAPSDRYLVGLATLTLLSGVASEQPVLCLVDDIHWLDRESVETLAFVARRLHADSLGLVFAARDGVTDGAVFGGLPRHRVTGLAGPEARILLAAGVPGHLDAAVADRIVAGTGGNPLAILELAGDLHGQQLAGVAALPEPLPVSRLLEEEHFRRSVAALPPDTRKLLLLMAAAPADDTAAMWRAAAVLGLSARTSLAEVAKVVADARRDPAAPPWSPDLVMEGLARRIAHGYADGAPVLRAALSRLRAAPELREQDSPVGVAVSLAADELWDTEARDDVIRRLATADRRNGALYGLVLALLVLATSEIRAGRFTAAEALYAEVDEYAAATGFAADGVANRALLYAWTGRERELRAAAAVMNDHAGGRGLGALAHHASHALCLLDLGRGRYPEALGHALPAFAEDLPPVGNLVLPLLVEAAVRVGDRQAAADALERLEERATIAGTPWALGLLARCRALTSTGDHAEALYLESIERLAPAAVAVEREWSRLLLGEWLRRRRRRTDARVQLRAAHEAFESYGAVAFAERARAELLATGEVARKRTVRTRYDLTARERHVASLAGAGLTNAEIATRLFVTTSTIEFHLNKVFRKLGITSRKRIAPALEREAPGR